jgi:hypothetical protein
MRVSCMLYIRFSLQNEYFLCLGRFHHETVIFSSQTYLIKSIHCFPVSRYCTICINESVLYISVNLEGRVLAYLLIEGFNCHWNFWEVSGFVGIVQDGSFNFANRARLLNFFEFGEVLYIKAYYCHDSSPVGWCHIKIDLVMENRLSQVPYSTRIVNLPHGYCTGFTCYVQVDMCRDEE